MKLYKTEGIILRSRKLKEADRIITVISPNLGRIEAVVKGVSRPKSKFGSRLELFNEVKLLLYKGRNLDTVTQVETLDSFKEIRTDLLKIAYGMPLLEVIEKVSLFSEGSEELFHTLKKALAALRDAKDNLDLIMLSFDLKVLSITGYEVNLGTCSCCGRSFQELTGLSTVDFSRQAGGIVCRSCTPSGGQIDLIKPEEVKFLKYLQQANFNELGRYEKIGTKLNEIEKVNDHKLSVDLGKLGEIIQSFLVECLDVKLKSRDFMAVSRANF